MTATFGFDEMETELFELAARFFDDQLPVTELRELVAHDPRAVYDDGGAPGWNAELWQRIVDMGWTAVAVPERADGTPIATAGLVGLVEQCGRHAAPAPLEATMAAALVLGRCDEAAANAALQRIAQGAVAALATTDATGSWDCSTCSVDATATADGVTLSGTAAFVQHAGKAELFVVQAALGEGTVLAVVDAGAEGVRVEADHIHDLTRDQGRARLDGAVAALVADDGTAVLEAAWPGVLALACADLCGTAEWLLQTTVDYASNREQFDRPIGFFQAVKHPLVNVMIEVDRARSLTYQAAALFDAGDDQALTIARMAKSAASDAASFAADRAVQLHGGIGFTWENDVHIWFKRALHGQALYGDGRWQRRLLADSLIGPVSDG